MRSPASSRSAVRMQHYDNVSDRPRVPAGSNRVGGKVENEPIRGAQVAEGQVCHVRWRRVEQKGTGNPLRDLRVLVQ